MSEDSLEERALALIKSRPNGLLQSELWKDLGIDSRKCSRIIARLDAEGKIKRNWETVKGTRTYRICYLPQKKEAPKKEVDFSLIMTNSEVAPCIGCTYECEPDYCPDLGNWIDLLARISAKEADREEQAKVNVKASEPEAAEPEEEVAVPATARKAPSKAAKGEKSAEKKAPKEAPAVKKIARAAKEPENKPLKAAKKTKR